MKTSHPDLEGVGENPAALVGQRRSRALHRLCLALPTVGFPPVTAARRSVNEHDLRRVRSQHRLEDRLTDAAPDSLPIHTAAATLDVRNDASEGTSVPPLSRASQWVVHLVSVGLVYAREGGGRMAKFMWHGSYSERGAKALAEEGGTKRRAGVEQAVRAMGGTLESMHFAFGDDDYYAIVDLPDNVSGAAISLATALAGAVRIKTVVLLTAEDLDEAARRAHEYRGPGARG
jgi:uncharacterized protein with GYD domain